MKIIRFLVLWTAGLSLVVSCAARNPAVESTASANPAAGKGKPNIVFILTDDQDAATMQFMPNLKSLIADRGETFSNYFVPESLCCPSRATTLRGQYPHETQILGNAPPRGGWSKFAKLGEEQSTVGVWLQNAGYRTMLAGKYLNGYPYGGDPLHVPPGWSEWYSPIKGNAYGEYNYTLNENGKAVAYGDAPDDYGTDVYVRKTLEFIQRSIKDGRPFFAYLAPYAPHLPYTPAPRHADLFPDVQAPRTPNFNEADVSDKPEYIRNHKPLTQKQESTIDATYRKQLQSLQAVDEGIAAMVKALQSSGQLDNTYIFFTSDNGFHLGNHRLASGKISPYEEELHLAMMVRGPGVPAGKTLLHLVGNVDLAQTWAELGGAQAADFCNGRSLVPLLAENPPELTQWRRSFPLEWDIDPLEPSQTTLTPASETEPGVLEPPDEDETSATALPAGKRIQIAVPYFRGVRLQTLSYVEYQTGEVELYDLSTDTYQMQNLAATANPQLLARLSALVKKLVHCKAAECRVIEDVPFDYVL